MSLTSYLFLKYYLVGFTLGGQEKQRKLIDGLIWEEDKPACAAATPALKALEESWKFMNLSQVTSSCNSHVNNSCVDVLFRRSVASIDFSPITSFLAYFPFVQGELPHCNLQYWFLRCKPIATANISFLPRYWWKQNGWGSSLQPQQEVTCGSVQLTQSYIFKLFTVT